MESFRNTEYANASSADFDDKLHDVSGPPLVALRAVNAGAHLLACGLMLLFIPQLYSNGIWRCPPYSTRLAIALTVLLVLDILLDIYTLLRATIPRSRWHLVLRQVCAAGYFGISATSPMLDIIFISKDNCGEAPTSPSVSAFFQVYLGLMLLVAWAFITTVGKIRYRTISSVQRDSPDEEERQWNGYVIGTTQIQLSVLEMVLT